MTLRSQCQMNRNNHSSSVKHEVEGKPHTILEKLKIPSVIGTFFCEVFLINCVHICISLNKNDMATTPCVSCNISYVLLEGLLSTGPTSSRLLTEPPEAGDKIKGQMTILEDQGTILEIFPCAPMNLRNCWILS